MSVWLLLPVALVVAGVFFGLAVLGLLLVGVALTAEVLVVAAFVCGLLASLVTLGVAAQ